MQEKKKKMIEADESFEVVTLNELRKYLSSSIFVQVGPVTAKKVVSAFRQRTIYVIERSSHELFGIRGVGSHRAKAIIEGWRTPRKLKKECMILMREKAGEK